MPAWTAPITWTNGAVTASQMNTEVRDHLVWLKAALDLLTGNTADDEGVSTFLNVVRNAVGSAVLQGRVSGDSQPRYQLLADGAVKIGNGSAFTEHLLPFLETAGTPDYRGLELATLSPIDVHAFRLRPSSGSTAEFQITNPTGTVIARLRGIDDTLGARRGELALLGTDGHESFLRTEPGQRIQAEGLTSLTTLIIGSTPGNASQVLAMMETQTPNTPPAGRAYLYVVESAGKQSLRIRWPGSAVTTLATEP